MKAKSLKFGAAILSAALLATAAGAQTEQPAFVPDAPGQKANGWTKAPEARPDTIRFVVVGDRTGLARPGVFEQAVKQADGLKPEFIINVGDLIEGGIRTTRQCDWCRDFAEVDLDCIARLARRAELPDRIVRRTAIETVERVRDLWPGHEPARALPDAIRQAVDAHMRSIPL